MMKGLLKVILNAYVLVSLGALPLLFMNLDLHALNVGESMYAEVAREMRTSGDWVTPRLNGTRHFDKPPLIYWLIALNQSLVGESESAARWWCAFAAWAMIPIVGMMGRRLYGERTGWLCSLVLATFLGPYIFGRMVMPDPIMCLLVGLAILSYLEGFRGDGRWRSPWCWLLFACLGVLPLTKGALGIILVLLIVGLHSVAAGIWRAFLSWRLLPGLGLTALLLAPWHMAMESANPGFFQYFYIREHFMRFSGKRFPPDESVLLPVFLGLAVVWTFPWFAFLPKALKRGFDRVRSEGLGRGNDVIAFVWIAVVMGIFSLSKSRLEYYSLPALPACALLIGKALDEALLSRSDAPIHRA
ncbi:MAG: glycosyltransferase family 39 protein, partial [Syntrophobacteraceae bacterium]|nr:glycosyltransferase family 39 protein [Syntrophobacteraceae bacterium]